MTSNSEKFTEQVAELTSEVKSVLKEANERKAADSEIKEKMGKKVTVESVFQRQKFQRSLRK